MIRVRAVVRVIAAAAALLVLPALANAQEEDAPPRTAAPKEITTARATRTPVKTIKVDVPIEQARRIETPEFRGEASFQQQCGVCHLGRWRKQGQLQPSAPTLSGVLSNASSARVAAVRSFILSGSMNMPAFRNTFTATELDELIAYLRTL